MPLQEERKKSVRRKLNILELEFKDKNVLLVDDSIVRGTTSRQIIEMVREAGAKKVLFASASPPVKYQNLYGIDMAATKELIAHDKTENEIADAIGADELIYQTLEDLIDSVKEGNPEIKDFETSIFTGRYPTAGGIGKEFAQPMYVNTPYGISLAHNGNLTNSKKLAAELFHAERRHINTDSDSEVLLNIFALELSKQEAVFPKPKDFFCSC